MGFASPLMIMKKSFRAKIFVMAALIIITISCSFTLFFINHDKRAHTDELSRQCELLASLLAHNARLGVFAADISMLQAVAEGITAHRDIISISIYGASGNLLLHKVKPGRAERKAQYAATEATGAPGVTIRDDTVEVTAPVIAEGGYSTTDTLFFDGKISAMDSNRIGTVRIVMDKMELNAREKKLVIYALLSMGLFLLIGSFVAYLIARSITRPLTALMQGVDELGSQGRYSKVAVETEDEVGGLAGAFNRMLDNLQRREHENRLLEEQLLNAQKIEAKKEWEQTFDTVPDLVAIIDLKRRVVRINRAMAEHLGLTKDAVTGMRIEEVGRNCSIFSAGNQEIRNPGEALECEIYDQARDSWFWLTVSPLMKPDGEQGGTVHVARDITHRKKAEAEKKTMQAKLIQTNKMASLGLLVSGMAHEVNNPNSNIIFIAHVLAKSWKDAESVLDRYLREEGDFRVGGHWYSQIRETLPQHISGIRDNARRIEGIIRNLKDFVRRGKAELSFDMDVNRIISVASSLVNNQIKRHTAHFELQFADNLPYVKGNPQQLEQVFINLIMNSLQALPDRERHVRITTTCDTATGDVIVTVADEGCGMTADVKANIFEPFFSTKMESGGTGLGLSISKFILDEHKAHIRFDSEPGKGTTATIVLPVGQQIESGNISAA